MWVEPKARFALVGGIEIICQTHYCMLLAIVAILTVLFCPCQLKGEIAVSLDTGTSTTCGACAKTRSQAVHCNSHRSKGNLLGIISILELPRD